MAFLEKGGVLRELVVNAAPRVGRTFALEILPMPPLRAITRQGFELQGPNQAAMKQTNPGISVKIVLYRHWIHLA